MEVEELKGESVRNDAATSGCVLKAQEAQNAHFRVPPMPHIVHVVTCGDNFSPFQWACLDGQPGVSTLGGGLRSASANLWMIHKTRCESNEIDESNESLLIGEYMEVEYPPQRFTVVSAAATTADQIARSAI